MAFVFSKIFWFLFNPGTLLVLGLLFGYLAGLAPTPIETPRGFTGHEHPRSSRGQALDGVWFG